MAEQAEKMVSDATKPDFDRSAALRRVCEKMNPPSLSKTKIAQTNLGDRTSATETSKGVKVMGRKGKYTRVRKHPVVDQQQRQPLCKHYKETEEERSERLFSYMEKYRTATQSESAEQRKKRLEKLEEEKRMKLVQPYRGREKSSRYENETAEQRQKRLAKYARNFRRKLENETVEKRERRLALAKISSTRSLHHKRLKKKFMKDNIQSGLIGVAPDFTTDLVDANLIGDSTAHLEYAKVVTERRKQVAEAIEKEHLEEMMALAEKSLNVKLEPTEMEPASVADLQAVDDKMPLLNVKIEKRDVVAVRKKACKTSVPVYPLRAIAPKLPSPQIQTDKVDNVIILQHLPVMIPVHVGDLPAMSNQIPWIRIEPDNAMIPGNWPCIIPAPTNNLPANAMNLPLLPIKTEKVDHVMIPENLPQIMTPHTNSLPAIATHSPLVIIKTERTDNVMIGDNCPPVVAMPVNNLQLPFTNEVPLLKIKTEKPDDVVN